jgi:hypothetical protein
MSRKKGQGKIVTEGKHPAVLFHEFAYGENHGARRFALYWQQIFELAKTADESETIIFKDTPQPPPGYSFLLGDRSPLSYFAVRESKRLLAILQNAIETRNGKFFRELADAINSLDAPDADPLRAYLIIRFFGTWQMKGIEQLELITAAELQSDLKKHRRLEVDLRHLRRTCEQLGIKLKESKGGRPKGAKGKHPK